MKKIFLYSLIFVSVILSCSKRFNFNSNAQTLDLSGKWGFREDPSDIGISNRWFDSAGDDYVNLPGSMATNGKGLDISVYTKWTGSIFDSSYFAKPEYSKYRQEGNIKVPFWLQPNKYYLGAAWYQKEITITEEWAKQGLQLVLERPHWETSVWIDDQLLGVQNSLSTAHRYDIGKGLTADKHTLTVRVDNRTKDIDPGQNAHSISDHTQTNWNGIVGRMYLAKVANVSIASVRLFPDIKTKKVKVVINLANRNSNSQLVNFNLQANQISGGEHIFDKIEWSQKVEKDSTVIEKEYDMGSEVALWDEFSPNLYALNITLSAPNLQTETYRTNFGFREVGVVGTNISINGRPTFLRGALDCAIFPLTGYPPTDTAAWTRIFKIVRSYGLNHIRFHSWCPPEAAFDAADSVGIYLQVESASWPNWGSGLGDGKKIDTYLYEETERILKAYGNHPSFIMFTHGNEPGGKNHKTYLSKFVSYFKKKDARRLYTSGAGWPVIAENDFQNISDPRIQQWEQGLKSIINAKPPQTQYDWSNIIAKHKLPVVSHEIGQWCVYPDLKEVKQYTGVLKAKNFEIFSDRLKENNLIHLADSFLLASGKLQVLCYKSDIEAALRTPGMAGFQLLGLQDFPGQGTALVGVVNPFWEDKGYVTSAEYSKFCNAVVPLARFAKMNMVNTEVLRVPVEVANFGDKVLENTILEWTISNSEGRTIFQGGLPSKTIAIGNGIQIGVIEQALTSIKKAEKLKLTIKTSDFSNSWDFFVYPNTLPGNPSDVIVTSELNSIALEQLNAGGKVLLTFAKGSIGASKGGNVQVGFSSIFWNTAWTNGQAPHTLGILCDPKHPALSNFPADFHSNWQWWDAMSHSNVILLDSVAPKLKPIVRVIDDWVTARSLGLLFECKVGKGKLLVSGIDLLNDIENRPEARQLLYSLQQYMSSAHFNPEIEVNAGHILKLIKKA